MEKDLVRAWKDPRYRESLEVLGETVFHPVGQIELKDEELKQVSGGALTTALTCTESSFRGWRACCP
ncbi:MAG: mersacidin/lichenicidin family type 2 lantibiotic [Thermoanaerobaculia bacterium]